MSAQIYLWLNSVLYLGFAFWCLWKPTTTANYNGLSFLNGSGKAEYLAIYVGLESGFAVFYGLCAMYPSIRTAGIIFSVCIYLGAMFARTFAVFYYGKATTSTYFIGGLEYVLGIWGILLLVNLLKQ